MDTKALRISSIALGDPRLAVINGKLVGEGEALSLKVGDSTVTLHVVKIGEGEVTLTDGSRQFEIEMAPEAARRAGKP